MSSTERKKKKTADSVADVGDSAASSVVPPTVSSDVKAKKKKKKKKKKTTTEKKDAPSIGALSTATIGTSLASKSSATDAKGIIENPRIIHFIWAGGKKELPDAELEVISQWSKNNPGCKVYLWVDKQTAEMSMVDHYKTRFSVHKVLEDDKDINVGAKSAPIILKDISEEGLRDACVAYEIDKLTPNYGASSDLLRYSILHKYGGAFFDSDVEPGKEKLASIFEKKLEKHTLYVDHCSQKRNVSTDQLREFNTSTVGNDTFISTKFNPLTLNIATNARARYQLSDSIEQRNIQFAHSGKNPNDMTIYLTGPEFIRETLQPSKKISNSLCLLNEVEIKKVRDEEVEFCKPKPTNSANWLKVREEKRSYSDALEAVKKTIMFEAKHFHTLRLDDHVDDIQACCQGSDDLKKPDDIAKDIYTYLEKKSSDKIIYTQVTGKYADTISYCKSKGMINLFSLTFDPGAKLAINMQASLGRFISYENSALAVVIAKKLDHRQIVEIVKNSLGSPAVNAETKTFLRQQIKNAINHFEYLLPHIQEFKESETRKEVIQYISEWLNKFNIYKDPLNNGVEPSKQVNSDKITDLKKQVDAILTSEFKTPDALKAISPVKKS